MSHHLQTQRNFRLTLEYDGSGYHGWQRQQGVLTIQEVVESCLEIMLGGPVHVDASGRTDAGVHAAGQVISFRSNTRLQPQEILRGLNSLLPPDIVVLDAQEADPSFHARFSALSKCYQYRILNRPLPSALERNYSWHVRRPLDIPPMREALERTVGAHDFSAFMASGSAVRSTERILYRAELVLSDPHRLVFSWEANGFLRHMVRTLVGTLVDVGKGKLTPDEFSAILASRDRKRAGMTAPAHGLCLVSVRYG